MAINDATAQEGKATKYAAFISYSHTDEGVGDWLHRRIEGYRVPSSLVGRDGPNGPIQKRIGKVFRDRVELSAAHDLGAEIRRALEQSESLIVLCSPRAYGSKYVAEEIRYFKQLGKSDRIFAAIVDGEPHAAGKPGHTAEDECFPRALIFRLDSSGELTSQPESNEPIAADFRTGRDGRESGSLKIIAGMLGIGLDELVQREKQADRARRLRANAIAAVMAVLAIGAMGGGIFAWWQRDIANQNEARAYNALTRIFAERSWQAIESEDYPLAARYALAGWQLSSKTSAEHLVPLRRILFESGDAQILLGHNAPVRGAILSGGGQRIVSWGGTNYRSSIITWDATTGRRVAEAEWKFVQTQAVALSPDGEIAAVALSDQTIRLLHVETGREFLHYSDTRAVRILQFRRDGAELLAVSDDGVARVWSLHQQRPLRRLGDQHIRVQTATYNPTTANVIAVLSDGTVRTWDPTTNHSAILLRSPTGRFLTTALSNDGSRLLASVDAYAAGILNLEDNSSVALDAIALDLSGAVFSPDNSLAATSQGNDVHVWSTRTGRRSAVLRGHVESITHLRFSDDNTRLLSASNDGTVRIWHPLREQSLVVLRGHNEGVTFAVINSDRTLIVTASRDQTVRLWDGTSNRELFYLPYNRPRWISESGRLVAQMGENFVRLEDTELNRSWDIRSAPEAPAITGIVAHSDKYLLTQSGESELHLWNTETRAITATIQSDELRSAEFSQDGNRLVLSDRRAIRIWDTRAAQHLVTINNADERSLAAVSFDGTRIALRSNDGSIAFLNGTSGQPYAAIQENGAIVRFAPDTARVLTLAGDEIRLWDVSSARLIWKHEAHAYDVSFSPDGSTVAVIDRNTIRVLNADSGTLLVTLRGHTDRVTSVSNYGNLVVTSSVDRTIRVWSISNGRQIVRLSAFGADGSETSFSANGRRLHTSSHFGSTHVWDVTVLTQDAADLVRRACEHFLSPSSRRFSSDEVGADSLIQEVWQRDGRADRDVCEGVQGTLPLD